MPEVLILSGPPAAGKSSVALALAERYDRVAHVQVDVLRHFVTPTGYVSPSGPPEAWQRQQRLATRNACSLAGNFLEQRFAVIVDDVVVTAEELAAYLDGLRGVGAPVHFVRLLPRLEVCIARNRERTEGRLPESRIRTVHAQFVEAGETGGVTIDNSEMTAQEASDRLQALTTSGASMIWTPSTGQASANRP
jgi:chloramphenicol 3-O-phosphotransferase